MNVRYDMIVCYVVRPDATGRSHEFLQLRRAADDYMGGTWQMIRGRLEGDERAWEGALRELREESGLVPREFYKLSLLEIFYLAHEETVWHTPAFCAVVGRDQEVKLDHENDAARWVPRSEITSVLMWPDEYRAIEEINREILENGRTKPYLRLTLG